MHINILDKIKATFLCLDTLWTKAGIGTGSHGDNKITTTVFITRLDAFWTVH